jgi:uncharacterized protein (DUF697 family)
MEFESQSQKAQQVLGLGREQLGQSMNLENQLFGQEQAKAAALQQARSAIYSGIGGIAQSVGSGLMGMNAQQNQMSMLQQMYPSGGGGISAAATPTAQAAFGSGASLASTINPSFGQATNLVSNPLFAPKPLQNVVKQGWAY